MGNMKLINPSVKLLKLDNNQYTFKFVCNRESFEYITYNSLMPYVIETKFDGTFIIPDWVQESYKTDPNNLDSTNLGQWYSCFGKKYGAFLYAIKQAEESYLVHGDKSILPSALKVEFIMTGTKDDWKYLVDKKQNRLVLDAYNLLLNE